MNEELIRDVEEYIKNTENNIDGDLYFFSPSTHPYTCEITGEIVDRPCWYCILPYNCVYKNRRK